jgi:hypothetical protein
MKRLEGFPAVSFLDHAVSLFLQFIRIKEADTWIVIDDKNSAHIFFLPFLFLESLELGTGSLGQALALGRI